jgi:hypothetical protein
MKIAIWAYTASVILTGFLTVALGHILRDILGPLFGGKPMPALTESFLEFRWWVFLVILPVVGTAFWLTTRGAMTSERAFAFTGLCTLLIISLLFFALLSFCLPFTTIIVHLE